MSYLNHRQQPSLSPALPERFAAQWGACVERYGRHRPMAGQKSFDWTEDEHPRETKPHDGKKPGEFAPKRYTDWDSQRHVRNKDKPTSFLTGHSSPPVREAAKTNAGLGLLITPWTQQYIGHAGDYSHIALDNGVYSEFTGSQPFSAEKFRAMIKKVASNPELAGKTQFVVAPDVVGDWEGTLERSKPWLSEIRKSGLPVAFAAQDGIEKHPDKIPWDDFDVLFIGGSTAWKLGFNPIDGVFRPTDSQLRQSGYNHDFTKMLREAKARGKRIHMGRVNSWKRAEMANYGMQLDTMDGNFIGVAPDQNLPKVLRWLEAITHGMKKPEEKQSPEQFRFLGHVERFAAAKKPEPGAKPSMFAGSPAFNSWFGGSKAIDESGGPKVLYHGTSKSFDQFGDHDWHYLSESPKFAGKFAFSSEPLPATESMRPAKFKIKKGSKEKNWEEHVNGYETHVPGLFVHGSADGDYSVTHGESGHALGKTRHWQNVPHMLKVAEDSKFDWTRPMEHFNEMPSHTKKNIGRQLWEAASRDPEIENIFGYKGAKDIGVGSQMKAVHAAIKNPVDLRSIPGHVRINPPKLMAELEKHGIQLDARDLPFAGRQLHHMLNDWNVQAKLRDAAIDAGYDGLVFNDWYDGQTKAPSWVAFHPEQIKSATGNRGTFDAKDARIHYRTDANIERYGKVKPMKGQASLNFDKQEPSSKPTLPSTPEPEDEPEPTSPLAIKLKRYLELQQRAVRQGLGERRTDLLK